MTDSMAAKFDVRGILDGLGKLSSPDTLESLSRSMCVAGGKVFRDEAKALAPVGNESGSIAPGTLKASIYLAYKDRSTKLAPVYSVTWNSKHAPHGHLVEFGHWQPYTDASRRTSWKDSQHPVMPRTKWIAAKPFLRPAYESMKVAAKTAMLQRGRERLAELLAEGVGNESAE